jgi:hypothetical protein
MSTTRTNGSIPDDCKECVHWDQVERRVRVRSLMTSMVGKLEARVTADEFKPTIGDFLKVLDAEKELELADEGPVEITVKWEELPPTSQS